MKLKNIILSDSDMVKSLEASSTSLGIPNIQIIDLQTVNMLDFLEASRYVLKRFCIVTRSTLFNKMFPNNIVYIKPDYDIISLLKEIRWILTNSGLDKNMDKNTYFWSDPHFYHANIIKYCNRPWNSGRDCDGNITVVDGDVEKMNAELISNFNSVVPKDGLTWCLGDFCLGPNQKEHIPEILSKLNGKVNLVLGNHDHHNVKFYYDAGFNKVYDRPVIINDFVILSHAPLEFVKAPFYNIFGHVHDCSTYSTWSKDSCCACVERHEYKPVAWRSIQEKYNELNPE